MKYIYAFTNLPLMTPESFLVWEWWEELLDSFNISKDDVKWYYNKNLIILYTKYQISTLSNFIVDLEFTSFDEFENSLDDILKLFLLDSMNYHPELSNMELTIDKLYDFLPTMN